MAKKIVLPKFLITIEMFNDLKDLPLKNPIYNEIGYKIQDREVISLLKKEGNLLKRKPANKSLNDYCCGMKELLLWLVGLGIYVAFHYVVLCFLIQII